MYIYTYIDIYIYIYMMYLYMVYILYHCHPHLPSPNDYTKRVFCESCDYIVWKESLKMRDTESHSPMWTTFYMAGCDSMCLTCLSTRSLHNDPVKRVNEETEAQICDVPQWERSTPVTQVALNPPCEARGCFGLRPHTGLDDLWVGHSWTARAWCSVDRCQSNREKTIEMTTWIMALAFNFLDFLSVRWVFSTPHPECSPRFTSRQRKAARGGSWSTDLASSWVDAVTSASGSWDFRNARAVCLRDTSCTLAGKQLGKQLWVFT